jgi:hypothetical protein
MDVTVGIISSIIQNDVLGDMPFFTGDMGLLASDLSSW